MLLSKVTSRSSRTVLAQCRNSLLLLPRQQQQTVPILSSHLHSLSDAITKVHGRSVSVTANSIFNAHFFERHGFSSSASPQPNVKENDQPENEQATVTESDADIRNVKEESASGNAEISDEDDKPDVEDLSRDELVKIALEKEELLKVKQEELKKMQDKYLRTYAEMENVMDRTRREAENSKKFAIQNFTKSLLDVADNLGRASSVVKDSFTKIDTSKDGAGAVPLLKTLLEGVEMTEKQLSEVFRKYGVEKYDPADEQFDPHRHNAVFQVPDSTKPPGTVAVVLKSGYTLHERIIRPAEVGVTVAVENSEAD